MYYVYAIVVDGVVRYIGRSGAKKGDRFRHHLGMVHMIARRRALGESVSTTGFYNKMVDAWRGGSSIDHLIIASGLTERQADKLEAEEIGSRKKLWNRLQGGDHATASRVLWQDDAYRDEQNKARKLVWKKDKKRKHEHAERMRAISNKLWADPEHRKKISKAVSKARRAASNVIPLKAS